MRSFRTIGIVIHSYNIGEKDRIVTFYSPHHGRIQTKVRGARKVGGKFLGHLEYFNIVDLQLYQKKQSILLTQCELVEGFNTIKNDLELLEKTSIILKLLKKLTYQNDLLQTVFTHTKTALIHIEKGYNPDLIIEGFKLKLLNEMGLIPPFNECSHCHCKFTPEKEDAHLEQSGALSCASCLTSSHNTSAISFPHLKVLKFLTHHPFSEIAILTLNESDLNTIKNLTNQLLLTHFPEIHKTYQKPTMPLLHQRTHASLHTHQAHSPSYPSPAPAAQSQ